MQVKVEYIDYGNHEQLPLSRLRPLDQSFCSLPYQSFSCFIVGIEPNTHLLNTEVVSEDMTSLSPWIAQLNQWMLKLLLGMQVDLLVVYCDGQNRIGVEIVLPSKYLYIAELLIDLPVQNMASIQKLVSQYSHIPLGCFMCLAGLSRPLSSSKQPFPLQHLISQLYSSSELLPVVVSGVSSRYILHPLEDSSSSEDEVCASKATVNENGPSFKMAVEVQCMNQDDQNDFSESVPLYATTVAMDSLHVTLSDKLGFCLIVSHVLSPYKFYVHPVQENVATEMINLSESLLAYYSVSTNCHHLSTQMIEGSPLCCVQLPNDKMWYRATLKSLEPKQKCVVQLIDYGEIHFISLENVYELAESFCHKPPQVVCCKLAYISNLNKSVVSSLSSLSITGCDEKESELKNIGVDTKLREKFHSLVKEKQLYAVVKNDGKGMLKLLLYSVI